MADWHAIAKAAWGWLYPDRCELCLRIGRPALCGDCRSELVPMVDPVQRNQPGNAIDLVASVYPFDGRAAQAVKRLKYSRATGLAEPMAMLLKVHRGLLEIPEVDLVIPVPIHWKRRSSRGFNQSEMLCEAFSEFDVDPYALRRIRATRPQVGLTRTERLNNLKGAFRADPSVHGKSVLLVDDVMTTGGTATACAEALRSAGATYVAVLTFCGERDHYTSGTMRP